MYRIKIKELIKWKLSNNRKPLVFLGARQVGKTWLLQEFGKSEYRQMVYVNFEDKDAPTNIYQKSIVMNRIMIKKIFFIFIFCMTAGIGFAQSTIPPLRIQHLTGNFYTYVSYGISNGIIYSSNAMYLVTKNGVVLFDTPWKDPDYQPLLDSIRTRHHKKILMCISTHFHDDRTGGIKYYASKGIKTYATHMTDSLCIVSGMNRAEYLIPNDTVFHVGGYTFQTYYPGAGHTQDNIVIWFPKDKILYGGCFIKSAGDDSLGNLSDSDVKAWASSLRRVQQKFPNPNYIIVGHNDFTDKNSLTHTLNLVNEYNAAHGQ